MYSSNQNDYQKFSSSPSPTAPLYGQPATGIPVTTNNYYSENTHATPQIQPNAPATWSTGLFDCFSNCSNCCITCWCPCITFGQISEIVDKGSSSCVANGALYALIAIITGCGCMYSCFYRSKIRSQYTLPENPCADCLVHCCCETCALCQEYRELENRGFDMSIGWQGNVEKQNRGVAMAPMTQGGMSR